MDEEDEAEDESDGVEGWDDDENVVKKQTKKVIQS